MVRASLSVSLDGYAAGPGQSEEHPLGVGGMALHDWVWATGSMRSLHGMEGGETGADDAWARRSVEGIGATVMGRNMFGPVRGPWGVDPWTGWWEDDPPFGHPVFVLTHHARPDLVLGSTAFHFVTGGAEAALAQALEAAGELDVDIGGGARTVRQYLAAGLLDELHVAVSPIVLGGGERLFDGLPGFPEAYELSRLEGTDRAAHHLWVSR